MAISVNLEKLLMKEYEDTSLDKLVKVRPGIDYRHRHATNYMRLRY